MSIVGVENFQSFPPQLLTFSHYKEEKETNKYTIEKEEFEKLKSDVKKILDNIEKLFEILGK